MNLLLEYKVWQNGEKAKLDNLWDCNYNNIFTSPNGKPIFPASISLWFHDFIKRHNDKIISDDNIPKKEKNKYLLSEVNFHGLRHTNATILINQGLGITTVSKRLDHARTSTTADIYAHSLQKADSEAANKLENLFNRKNIKNEKQS